MCLTPPHKLLLQFHFEANEKEKERGYLTHINDYSP